MGRHAAALYRITSHIACPTVPHAATHRKHAVRYCQPRTSAWRFSLAVASASNSLCPSSITLPTPTPTPPTHAPPTHHLSHCTPLHRKCCGKEEERREIYNNLSFANLSSTMVTRFHHHLYRLDATQRFTQRLPHPTLHTCTHSALRTGPLRHRPAVRTNMTVDIYTPHYVPIWWACYIS